MLRQIDGNATLRPYRDTLGRRNLQDLIDCYGYSKHNMSTPISQYQPPPTPSTILGLYDIETVICYVDCRAQNIVQAVQRMGE